MTLGKLSALWSQHCHAPTCSGQKPELNPYSTSKLSFSPVQLTSEILLKCVFFLRCLAPSKRAASQMSVLLQALNIPCLIPQEGHEIHSWQYCQSCLSKLTPDPAVPSENQSLEDDALPFPTVLLKCNGTDEKFKVSPLFYHASRFHTRTIGTTS